MKIITGILCICVGSAFAQYDFTPQFQQQRGQQYGAPEPEDEPAPTPDTYGPPNHTPGKPIGPSSLASLNLGSSPSFAPLGVDVGEDTPIYPHAPSGNGGYNRRPAEVSQPAPNTLYGYPQQDSPAPPPPPPSFAPAPVPQQPVDSQYGVEEYTPKVYKHVYVHSAPDEPVDVQTRVIRVPGGDKHVNIIFVKTPSSSSRQETEVILPEQDEHKNLVYVLLRKGEHSSDVKIRRPPSPPQRKPEVYFIRYAGPKKEAGGYDAASQASQAPPPPPSNGEYGLPL